jgi:hypothetical protein
MIRFKAPPDARDNDRSPGVVCFYTMVPLAEFDAAVVIGIH